MIQAARVVVGKRLSGTTPVGAVAPARREPSPARRDRGLTPTLTKAARATPTRCRPTGAPANRRRTHLTPAPAPARAARVRRDPVRVVETVAQKSPWHPVASTGPLGAARARARRPSSPRTPALTPSPTRPRSRIPPAWLLGLRTDPGSGSGTDPGSGSGSGLGTDPGSGSGSGTDPGSGSGSGTDD